MKKFLFLLLVFFMILPLTACDELSAKELNLSNEEKIELLKTVGTADQNELSLKLNSKFDLEFQSQKIKGEINLKSYLNFTSNKDFVGFLNLDANINVPDLTGKFKGTVYMNTEKVYLNADVSAKANNTEFTVKGKEVMAFEEQLNIETLLDSMLESIIGTNEIDNFEIPEEFLDNIKIYNSDDYYRVEIEIPIDLIRNLFIPNISVKRSLSFYDYSPSTKSYIKLVYSIENKKFVKLDLDINLLWENKVKGTFKLKLTAENGKKFSLPSESELAKYQSVEKLTLFDKLIQ